MSQVLSQEALAGFGQEAYAYAPGEGELRRHNFILTSNGSNGAFHAAYIDNLPDSVSLEAWDAYSLGRLFRHPRLFHEAGLSEEPVEPRSKSGADTVGLYLREASRAPLLTGEGEQILARAIMAGQQAVYKPEIFKDGKHRAAAITTASVAYEKLFESNLRLTIYIARRAGAGSNLMDAIQDGNVGLMHACAKFDFREGTRFNTYATRWIKQAIKYSRGARVPGAFLPLKPLTATLDLQKYLENTPGSTSWDEAKVAKTLEMSPKKLALLRRAQKIISPMSLDAQTNADSDSSGLYRVLGDPKANTAADAESEIMKLKVAEAAERLPEIYRAAFLQKLAEAGLEIADLPADMKSRLAGLGVDGRARIVKVSKAMLLHPSVGLVQHLGDQDESAVSSAASCIGEDPRVFFTEASSSSGNRKRRQMLCGACPVRSECENIALSNKLTVGSWGGKPFNPKRWVQILKEQAEHAAQQAEDVI